MEEAHLILLLLPKVQTKSNKKWAKPNNLERKTKKKKFFFTFSTNIKRKKKVKVEEINSGQNLKKRGGGVVLTPQNFLEENRVQVLLKNVHRAEY
jgi:hypothetical protein